MNIYAVLDSGNGKPVCKCSNESMTVNITVGKQKSPQGALKLITYKEGNIYRFQVVNGSQAVYEGTIAQSDNTSQ